MKLVLIIAALLITSQCFLPVEPPKQVDCNDLQYKRAEVFYIEGQASISSAPTFARIVFGIEVSLVSAAEALSRVNSIVAQATKSLVSFEQDNSKLKVETNSFSLQPDTRYEWDQRLQKNVLKYSGYKVSQNIVIETSNLKIVGQLIDAAVIAGVTNVFSINYDLNAQEKVKLRNQLLALSIEDAKQKAQIILDKLDMEIVGIKSISIQDQHVPHPMAYKSAQMNDMAYAAGAPTEIFAKDQSMDQRINIGYIIKAK